MGQLLDLSQKMEKIINSMATVEEMRRAWRIAVKERLDQEFEEDVPWELCNALMNIEWEANALRNAYKAYDSYLDGHCVDITASKAVCEAEIRGK